MERKIATARVCHKLVRLPCKHSEVPLLTVQPADHG